MTPILCIAPHAIVPTDDAVLALLRPELRDDPRVQAEAREWEEAGVIEARDAFIEASGALTAPVPTLPRWICDLNRPWEGTGDTLLGKPAVPLPIRPWLRDGALDELHAIYRADLLAVRRLADTTLVEPHSYGALGSTFDQAGRGRPVARPATALIVGAPWRTAHPTGLARLIPPTLDATPWGLQVAVGDALDAAGLTPGLNPYGTLLPWGLSTRALASAWFRFLAAEGELSQATAQHLEDLAWSDSPAAEAPTLPGTAALIDRLEHWGHDSATLADRFRASTPAVILVAELREDLARAGRAADFGQALASGVLRHGRECSRGA